MSAVRHLPPQKAEVPKPVPRPSTPLADRNKIRLENLSHWLQGFEDDDAHINKMNQSFLEYDPTKPKKQLRGGVTLVRLDPDPTRMAIRQNDDEGEQIKHDHPNNINSWDRLDEEAHLQKAVKRTRFLLSRLGTSLRPVDSAESDDIPRNHEPLFDWHLRPATSHMHHDEPKPELPSYSIGVLHKNEPTAMPILKVGWTWREIPLAKEADCEKKNVYSLINRGYVPQGSDLSRLMAPSEQNPTSIIKQSKAKLNKAGPHTWDPVKRYSTFDRPAPIPFLLKPQKKLPPLPDIATNAALQKEVAKTLGIESRTKSMRMLEKLAYVESPQSIIRYKPPCPIERGEEIPLYLRRPTNHNGSQVGRTKLIAPPGTRQTSASYNPADSIRTDPSSNWTIFIKDGFVVSTSDAYLNFQSKFNEIWPQIRYFIWKAETLLQRYAVPCAEIKCTSLISLATVIPAPAGQLSLAALQQMLFNADEVLTIIKKPGQIYKGTGLDSVQNLAARRIQNIWSAYKSRIELKDYHEMMISSMTMIKSFRLKKFRTELYRQILGRFEILHKKRFYGLMNALMLEWKETNMAIRPKVILQMAPRFSSVDIMDYIIGRVLMLYDGYVETLILVIPFLTPEKDKYIREQLACGFLDLDPLKNGRLILISPETAKCFVPGSSVCSMLQSSHKALARVKGIIDGKLAMLMTDCVGRAEIGLSSHLDIPLYGPKPEKAKRVNTRHKARVFLRNAGFEVAPGMSFKPGIECQIKETLLLLTSKYPSTVAIWEVFEKRRSSQLDFAKPDCACDAWIDIDKVPKPPVLDEKTLDETYETFDLRRSLKLQRCPSYFDFINRFCGIIGPKLPSNQVKGTGGFIQACPVRDGTHMRRVEIGFLLDPLGKITQFLSAEVVVAKDFEQIGIIVPQQRLPHAMLLKIVDRLQGACIKGGIVGYVTLQLTVWRDIVTEKNGWWANNFYPFLSPNLLKASSVLVSTGCEIDSKTGISSFQWTDIPLHLERTQNAVFTNHPMLRRDFENTIMKQAGGNTEYRVAIYADNLRNAEITRMTWRGFVNTCHRDGIRFNDKTRKGTYFPLVNPDIPMLMPMCTVASDYKSAIQAFLKDLTICHRRLKHYDVPDLVSNIKDTARQFIKDWKNLDDHPELYISAAHFPDVVTDAYKSIFNLQNNQAGLPPIDEVPKLPSKSIIMRGKDYAKHSRQPSSTSSPATPFLKEPGVKKILHEDLISSDSDDSFTEDHVDRQTSIIIQPTVTHVKQPEFQTIKIGDDLVPRPLTAIEKQELFNLKKLRNIRLADKPQPPAWWDTFTFVPTDPSSGTIHHVDPYDPKNKANKHFELDPAVNPNAHEDLDILVATSIPALNKLAASSRPVTSCHRKIQAVLEEIERSKRPPPPPRAQRSSETISLLNEGVPSVIAGKYDPTFKKPHITPPVKQTERYLKIKRGEYSSTDMAVIEAALDKYEAIYEEKFPSEQPLLEVKKKKKTPGSRVMFGGVESNFEETEEEMLRSQTDVAVAAAFALMKEVNARDIDAPATPRRSNSPRTNTSLKDLTIITPDQKEPKGKSPLSQERGKSPLSQIVPQVIADGDSDDAIENSGNPKGIIVSNENSQGSSPPPLEVAALKLDSTEEPRKSSAIVVEDIPLARNNARRKSEALGMSGGSHMEDSLRPFSRGVGHTASSGFLVAPRSRTGSQFDAASDRVGSPATEDLKRQMIEEKSSNVMAHLNSIVNRDEKGDRLKNMLGSLLMGTRNHEDEAEATESGSSSHLSTRLNSRGKSSMSLNRSNMNIRGSGTLNSKSSSPP